MKIWCQSCGGFGKDAVWNDYEQALKRHAQTIARPDTVVDFYGVEMTIPGIDQCYAAQSICEIKAIRNAIRAEREGYNAFVIINTLDVGFKKIREVVDIPVVFMLENSIHFALRFAPRFAFLTHNESILSQSIELANQYGLAGHMVPGDHLDFSFSVWPDLYTNPDKYIDLVMQKAKEIIARGAGMLIAAALPFSVWLIKQGLIEINGARILDNLGCAIKMAELMVELEKNGITRKKPIPAPKELLAALGKLY